MGATPTAPKSRRRSPAQPRRAATAAAPRPQIAPDERIGVAYLTAEYWPFARAGGLGEAVSGLATCQAAAGLPTTVFMPLYQIVRETTPSLERTGSALAIPLGGRSEEHTSELQSPCNLVCRLLLEKKKKRNTCTML